MKNHFTIPPSIEKRLQVWTDWAERQTKQNLISKPSITISREYGCQAYMLGEALFQRLSRHADEDEEWTMLDRLLLEKIVHESGQSMSEINYITQLSPTFQSMMANLIGSNATSPEKAFSYIKETIRYFAKAGNSIIIGRGGVCITQNLPNMLHIRLIAPMSFKVATMVKGMGIPESEARKHIEARQDERDKFIKHFTHKDIQNPKLYHLIINNAKSTIDEMADLIVTRLKSL